MVADVATSNHQDVPNPNAGHLPALFKAFTTTPSPPKPMHASRLVELAIATAQLHRSLIDQVVTPESWRSDEFWVLSRARVNEWSRFMKACEQSRHGHEGQFEPRLFWRATEPLLEEVFLAEVCTRVWCATLTTVDEIRWQGELSPIARSVFVASLEVRRHYPLKYCTIYCITVHAMII